MLEMFKLKLKKDNYFMIQSKLSLILLKAKHLLQKFKDRIAEKN